MVPWEHPFAVGGILRSLRSTSNNSPHRDTCTKTKRNISDNSFSTSLPCAKRQKSESPKSSPPTDAPAMVSLPPSRDTTQSMNLCHNPRKKSYVDVCISSPETASASECTASSKSPRFSELSIISSTETTATSFDQWLTKTSEMPLSPPERPVTIIDLQDEDAATIPREETVIHSNVASGMGSPTLVSLGVSSASASLSSFPPSFRRFQELETEIQEQILSYLLPSGPVVRPSYRYGMLKLGLRAPVEDDTGVTDRENFNSSLFLVNRSFRYMCSRVVYGRNTFTFTNAALCKWWIKHIGQTNLSNLRSLHMQMLSGWQPIKDEGGPEALCEEEFWFQILCWLQFRHKLDHLCIDIRKWNPSNRIYTNHDSLREIRKWRLSICSKLSNYRGIRAAEIRQGNVVYFNRREETELTLVMMQPKSTIPKREEYKIPLERVLQEIRDMIQINQIGWRG